MISASGFRGGRSVSLSGLLLLDESCCDEEEEREEKEEGCLYSHYLSHAPTKLSRTYMCCSSHHGDLCCLGVDGWVPAVPEPASRVGHGLVP